MCINIYEKREKACSSSIAAEGLLAGCLRKQHRRKSFPLADNVSGIGGELRVTLNIA